MKSHARISWMIIEYSAGIMQEKSLGRGDNIERV
jgi:hypothetical protein